MYPFRKDISPYSSGLLTDIGEGLTAIQQFDLKAHLDESLLIEIKQMANLFYCNIWHRLNAAIERALDASKRIVLNENQLNVQNYYVMLKIY